MTKKKQNNLIFLWQYKDYALEAVPTRLARFTADEPNETIDFVKYFDRKTKKGTALKYSIGYFHYNENESHWELKFVGDRFADIAEADLPAVWEGLKSAYRVLTLWKDGQNAENL